MHYYCTKPITIGIHLKVVLINGIFYINKKTINLLKLSLIIVISIVYHGQQNCPTPLLSTLTTQKNLHYALGKLDTLMLHISLAFFFFFFKFALAQIRFNKKIIVTKLIHFIKKLFNKIFFYMFNYRCNDNIDDLNKIIA